MSIEQIISREEFQTALVEGIPIQANQGFELFDFGERMIKWINNSDNEYWAAWSPRDTNDVIIDVGTCPLMHLTLSPGKLVFRQPDNGAATDRPKDFGNGAVGVMLFCMVERGLIDQVEPDEPAASQSPPPPERDSGEATDFDWI